MSEFNVTVRNLSGQTYVVQATPDTTIAGLKALVEKEAGLPASEIKFVYRGKILKAADEKLKDHNITAETPISMVHQKPEAAPAPNVASAAAQPASAAPGAGPAMPPFNPMGGFDLSALGGLGGAEGLGGINMDQIQQAMANPAIRQQVASLMQNPEVLRTAFQNHPLGRQLAQQNPQLSQMLDNPEMAAQLGNMMSMFSGFGGGTPAAAGTAPAPGLPPVNFGNLLNSLNAGASAATPAAPPEEQYRDQLAKLNDMGFLNKELNIQALSQSMGNVDLAVEKLLSWMK